MVRTHTVDTLMLLHHGGHEVMVQLLAVLALVGALLRLQLLVHSLRLHVAGLPAVRDVAQVHGRRRRYCLVLDTSVH